MVFVSTSFMVCLWKTEGLKKYMQQIRKTFIPNKFIVCHLEFPVEIKVRFYKIISMLWVFPADQKEKKKKKKATFSTCNSIMIFYSMYAEACLEPSWTLH